MGARPRIRWPNVAKLAAAVIACAALLLGLPSLMRRPEPPPLEPDIGLASVPASRAPAPPQPRPEPKRRAPRRGEAKRRDGRSGRPGDQRELRSRQMPKAQPEGQVRLTEAPAPSRPAAPSPQPAAPPSPTPAPTPAAYAAPPPGPAPERPAPQPSGPPEFGFEH